jgi:hypothetical protein
MLKKRKKNFLILLVFAIAGFVIFFPWKFENGSTCMADQFAGRHELHESININYETRIKNYIIPYGLMWWVSIALISYILFVQGKSERSSNT